MPRYLVKDIDTMEDWRQAELMHEALTHFSEMWEQESREER